MATRSTSGTWAILITRSIALVVISLPGVALAQAVPATPPPTPQVPTRMTQPSDFPAPGRRPAAAQVQVGTANAGAKTAPTGYSGGDYIVSDVEPGLYGEGERVRYRRPVPEYHLVKDGDSLWKVCAYYYGDPWMWPRLWAQNPSITNPHWIYPGDKIRMIDGKKGVKQPGGKPTEVAASRRYGRGAIVLRQSGFVDEGELDKAGRIVGSKRESLMLATYNEVYVRGGERFRPEVGKFYTIYKVRSKLRSGDKVYGHVVEILGTLRVKKINDRKVATAEITEAVAPIERGHLVGPLRRSLVRLAVRPAQENLDGKMFATYRRAKHIGSEELAFIDRGRKHGVHLGNRFLVLRRGDGYRKVLVDAEKDNPDFPREVIAEITILDVRDEFCVGLVTRTTKELRPGEHVRLRRGY